MGMIPKKVHYIWFGKGKKNRLVNQCIKTWERVLAGYEIKEWDEECFNVNTHQFTKKAYRDKNWAFVSDYARLRILYDYGGIYLDTDMEVIKTLDSFLSHGVFIGMESNTHLNGSIIGAKPKHWLIKEILKEYDYLEDYTTIPVIITRVFKKHIKIENKEKSFKDVTIYPSEYFYPTPFGENFSKKHVTENTHTIHWWNHSWGSFSVRVANKLSILKLIRCIKNRLFKNEQ